MFRETLKDWNDPVRNVNNAMYERMRPALRLATHFLRLTEDFFVKLTSAEQIQNLISGGRDDVTHLDSFFRATAENKSLFHELMRVLPGRVKFFTGCQPVGQTGANPSFHAVSGNLRYKEQPLLHYVQFRDEYASLFRMSEDEYHGIPDNVKHRAWFCFAVTLVHELAHILFRARSDQNMICVPQQSNIPSKPIVEPKFIISDRSTELGDAWEEYYFQGYPNFGHRLSNSRPWGITNDWRLAQCILIGQPTGTGYGVWAQPEVLEPLLLAYLFDQDAMEEMYKLHYDRQRLITTNVYPPRCYFVNYLRMIHMDRSAKHGR